MKLFQSFVIEYGLAAAFSPRLRLGLSLISKSRVQPAVRVAWEM